MDNNFEDKYEFEKDSNIKDFHSSRRMFAIKDGQVYLADMNSTQSHAEWFYSMGWITKEDDTAMFNLIRGFVDNRGIFFYVGYNFSTTEEVEKIFIVHLSELVEKLKISADTHVYAGCIIQNALPFPPKKDMGSVQELLVC